MTSDENVAVGFLVELPDFEGSDDLLRAARLAGAMSMLRRSGFHLILLPGGTAVQMEKRRWWRRGRNKRWTTT